MVHTLIAGKCLYTKINLKKAIQKGINMNKEWAHTAGKVVSTKGFGQADVLLQASVSSP